MNTAGVALEKTDIALGFIPLSDCAPLVVAQELGFFEREGLAVTLSREQSWAAIRDKVSMGILDGAQMLASMPISSRLAVGGPKVDLISAMVLSLNGNAITVGEQLYQNLYNIDPAVQYCPLTAARCLKELISTRPKHDKLRFAMVYPSSPQSFELRYWLACGDIDPDRDVEIVVIPPVQMVAALRDGNIKGFCVGEPWNTLAVQQQLGHVLASKYQLWNNSPEKVFAVTEAWSDRHPESHQALLRALLNACRWLDIDANRGTAASMLSQPHYVDLPEETLQMSLCGLSLKHPDQPPEAVADFHVFNRYSANFPWLNHAEWFIAQLYRWGHLRTAINIEQTAATVYRPALFREAAHSLGMTSPSIDRKTEGDLHNKMLLPQSQQLGPNQFLDRQVFKVGGVIQYLQDLSLCHANIEALTAANQASELSS